MTKAATTPHEPKHTPGPWQHDDCLSAAGHITIRQADHSPHGNTEAEPIATVYRAEDARLIAAAPELAAALADLLRQAETANWHADNSFMRNARLALAKAGYPDQAPAPRSTVREFMTQAGFSEFNTGGDCMAWRKVLEDGRYCLITEHDAGDLGENANPEEERWDCGRYTQHGVAKAYQEENTLIMAVAWCEAKLRSAD